MSSDNFVPAANLLTTQDAASMEGGNYYTHCTHLGVLEVKGPEAAKFLQGQATADFRLLNDQHSLPAMTLSLKGRALESFRALASGESLLLILPRELAQELATRWQRYIAFSKATLTDVSDEWRVLGLNGSEAAMAWGQDKTLPESFNAAQVIDGVRIANVGENRWLLAVPAAQTESVICRLRPIPSIGVSGWLLGDIRLGQASITLATRDQFLPQMLHYQAIEGLSFEKGCYTGQEVVARAWFRGQIKQSMHRLTGRIIAPLLPGAPLNPLGQTQAIGNVVQAVVDAEGHCELLAVVRDDIDFMALNFENFSGEIREESLPYAIPNLKTDDSSVGH